MAKFKLMKHQRKGVKFIQKKDGVAALLYEPGVGKTGTTLAYIDRLADELGEVRVLVVAPMAAVDTWVLQPPMFMDSPTKARFLQGTTRTIIDKIAKARDWTQVPDTKIKSDHGGGVTQMVSGNKVTIISISAGAVSSWCKDRQRTLQMLSAIRKFSPDLIVVDESHIIKSGTANISKAMSLIGRMAKRRIILTGTVTPQSPLDVYGQWMFLAPWTFSDQYGEKYTKKPTKMTAKQLAEIRPWSWGRFSNRYAAKGGYGGHQITGYINLKDLNTRVAERSQVVLKEDALDLPPVRDVIVPVHLTAKEQKFYDDMRKDLAAELEDGTLLEAPNALAKMMKLRQITTGFVKDTDTKEVHVVGTSKQNAVSEVVSVTLAGEQRVVVFAFFKRECEMLKARLEKDNPGAVVEVITGKTKPKERLEIRQRFGDVSRNPTRTILVAQARTMSVSVNELITAQNAVFASLSERSQDWVQARGRLDRNGQEGQHVTFWNVLVPDSIDTIMLDRNKDKGDLEKSLLDHIRAVNK